MEEIFAAFAGWSERTPDKLAVADRSVSLSYRELAEASDFVAATLAEHGLKPGDITVFMGSNGVQRVAAFLGFLKAGVATVFLDPRNPPATWREWAEHAEAKALVSSADGLDSGQVLASLPEIRLPFFGRDEFPRAVPVRTPHATEMLAYINYTSGSTGKPKGVPVRRSVVTANVKMALDVSHLTPDDRTGMTGQLWTEMILTPLAAGASFHTYDFAGLGAEGLGDWLAEEQINVFSTYTAAARAINIGPSTFWPVLRMFRVAGEAVLRADLERLSAAMPAGAIIENSFGLSEYSWISGYEHVTGQPLEFDTVPLGYAYEPERFLLLGQDGSPVAPNEVGEIAIRSPDVIRGYWKDPERSASVLRKLSADDEHTTFFTGDYAFMDEKGLIRSAGRADEQVKIRGYNVRPTEIEAVLAEMPGLLESAVVPFVAPNGIRRLACHYVIETEQEIPGTAIREYLRARVPGYMVPGHFVQRTEFPRTRTGKIDRKNLPDPLAGLDISAATSAERLTPTEQLVRAIWADVLGHQNFTAADDFFDVGGDSLQAMAVVTAIAQQADVRMPLESLILEGATIRDLAERILQHGATGPAGLTALNRGGAGGVIWAVPVVGGHLSDYLAVAHELEGHYPVNGLTFHARGNGQQPSALTIADLAEHALSGIALPPSGVPVVIMGYSFGGMVALEIARQLVKEGRSVSLVIIDTIPVWLDRWRHLRGVWRAARRGSVSAGISRAAGAVGRAGAAQHNVEEAHILAGNRYDPAPIEGARTLFIQSAGVSSPEDQLTAWRLLAGPDITVAQVAGDHYTMMRDENAASVSKVIRHWIAENI